MAQGKRRRGIGQHEERLFEGLTWFRSRVYFVAATELALVKIGTATNIEGRFSSLEGSSPVPLTLVGYIAGGVQVERWLHFHCFADRSHREWFRSTPQTKRLVARVLAHGANAAKSMCPIHLRDDLLTAVGRLAKNALGPLPRTKSEIDVEIYRELNSPDVTPLDFCKCNICQAVEP